MKTALILFFGCLPLVALTASSLRELLPNVSSSEQSATIKKLVGEAQTAADEAARRKTEGERAVQQLAVILPFSEQSVDPPEGDATPLKELAASLARAQRARALIRTSARLETNPPRWSDDAVWLAAAKEKLTTFRKRLDDFILVEKDRAEATGGINGASELFALLAKRRAALDGEIEVLTATQDGLALFNDGRYHESLVMLGQIGLDKVADPAKQTRLSTTIRRCRARAEYWSARTAAHVEDRSLDLPTVISRISSFVEKYPDAPHAIDEQAHQRLKKRLSELEARPARDERRGRLTSHIAALAANGNLDDLRVSAEQVAKEIRQSGDIDDAMRAQLLRQARAEISRWLTTKAFPRKELPKGLEDEDNQEGYANHRRYIGAFDLQGSLLWYFWRWDGEKSRTKNPGSDERIGKDQLSPLIKPPMYVKWAQQYNSSSRQLSLAIASSTQASKHLKQEWQKFFEECEATQAAIEVYRNQWGVQEEPDRSCKELNFLPDKNVLPHASFEELSQKLEHLWSLLEP